MSLEILPTLMTYISHCSVAFDNQFLEDNKLEFSLKHCVDFD